MTQSTPPNLANNSATAIREIEELGIAIAAKNLNPTMLSEEFLKFSGIISNDWELARQPMLSPRLSQLAFKNGVNIVAQPGTITFFEPITNKNLSQLQTPTLARKYVEKLPNAEYEAVSISPKSLIPFQGKEDAARNFLTQTFLAPGAWQKFGKAPVQAGLNLFYQLDECQLNLAINEARLQPPEKPAIPALLFSGSFNYNLSNYSLEERVSKLSQIIDKWQSDLQQFQELVNQKFLSRATGQPETVFPPGMIEM